MGTEAGWTEKVKEDWAKFRAAFEAYIPGADKSTPEEVAQIQEDRRQYMDYVEKTYAGMPDSELMQRAMGTWYMIYWWSCISVRDIYERNATTAVLESRGYDIGELYNKWYVEAVASVKATVNALVSEGEPLQGMVRAVVAQATNKETGEVDWAMVDNGLMTVAEEGNGIDDTTLARHGFSRSMDYWARKEVAAVIDSRDGFVAARAIGIAAKTIHTLVGGPAVDWIEVLRELRALGYWDNMHGLKDSEFEQRRALAAYLDEETAKAAV